MNYAKVSIVVVSTNFFCVVAFAQIGVDTCLGNGQIRGGDTHVWRVNQGMADLVFSPGLVSTAEVIHRFDSLMQYSVRQNRHHVRNRVFNSSAQNCLAGPGVSQSCLTASVPGPFPDYNCYPLGGPAVSAYANCDALSGACWIVLCPDVTGVLNDETADFHDHEGGVFDQALVHGLAQTWGLNHVDQGYGSPMSCGPPISGTCDPGSVSNNGCSGEQMCSGACGAPHAHYGFGDSLGLRKQYQFSGGTPPGSAAYGYRKILKSTFGGSIAAPTSPVLSDMHRASAHKPRIDCAREGSAENDCAMVRTIRGAAAGNNRVEVRRLFGWTATSWSVGGGPKIAQRGSIYEPDVAVTPDGRHAWVTFADRDLDDALRIVFVDLDPASPTYQQFADFPLAEVGAPILPTLPPRIVYLDAIEEPAIIALTTQGPKIYSIRNSAGYGIGSPTQLVQAHNGPNGWDTINQQFFTSAEIDVACGATRIYLVGNAFIKTNECVVVAVHNRTDLSNGEVTYRRFVVNTLASSPLATWEHSWLDSGWTTTATSNNSAVIGVSYDPSWRIHVSSAYRVSSATAQWNSQFMVIDPSTQTTTTDFLYKSDTSACAAHLAEGSQIPPLTPFGGESISYCASCGSGAIEGLAFGDADDGPANYCY